MPHLEDIHPNFVASHNALGLEIMEILSMKRIRAEIIGTLTGGK